MKTAKLLVFVVMFNLLLSICAGLYNTNPQELDETDDKLIEYASQYQDTQVAEGVQGSELESTVRGNSKLLSQGFLTILTNGVFKYSPPEQNLTNLEYILVYGLNTFRIIINILLGLLLLQLLWNKKQD